MASQLFRSKKNSVLPGFRLTLGFTLFYLGLIVLIPLIIVQAVAMQIFYGTHLNLVSRRLSAAVTGEIARAVS